MLLFFSHSFFDRFSTQFANLSLETGSLGSSDIVLLFFISRDCSFSCVSILTFNILASLKFCEKCVYTLFSMYSFNLTWRTIRFMYFNGKLVCYNLSSFFKAMALVLRQKVIHKSVLSDSRKYMNSNDVYIKDLGHLLESSGRIPRSFTFEQSYHNLVAFFLRYRRHYRIFLA